MIERACTDGPFKCAMQEGFRRGSTHACLCVTLCALLTFGVLFLLRISDTIDLEYKVSATHSLELKLILLLCQRCSGCSCRCGSRSGCSC